METQSDNQTQTTMEPHVSQIEPDPQELEHIVSLLTSGPFDIDYIILFGQLVGGTPFSGVAAYDMLIVTNRDPAYDEREVKRYLKYHLPIRQRDVTYYNVYVIPYKKSLKCKSPISYLAHTEGRVIYSRVEDPLLPTRGCDFMALYSGTRVYFRAVHAMARRYLGFARVSYDEEKDCVTAMMLTAQAAAMLYRTLHYVYYGEEIDSDDLIIMHDKLRTLDGELMLLFDGTHIGPNTILPTLQGLRKRFPFDSAVNVVPPVLEACMDKVQRLGDVVENICTKRLNLYRKCL